MSWENNLRKVTPYVPGEQPKGSKFIKLNTNENPYPPAPGVKRLIEEYNYDELRLYPSPTAESLTRCLAERYQVGIDRMFVGVGSDDVLAVAFLSFFNAEKPILFADITYSFYPVWANLYRIPFQTPKLDENFQLIKEDYYQPNGGVVIANPNAPTGISVSVDFIEDIVKHNQDSVVIVDEAYVDFGAESCLPLIDRYENLLVVQTFSKSRSMAGMRVGFAMGSKKLIDCMNAVKASINSYTMNRPTLAFALEAVNDDAYFRSTCGKVIATRERTKKKMRELGFICTDSATNFLFVSYPGKNGEELLLRLREEGILVRHFKADRISEYVRISIGTEDEMDKLLTVLKKIILE